MRAVMTLLFSALLLSGCASTVHHVEQAPAPWPKIDPLGPWLNVHMLDSSVFLMETWEMDSITRTIVGSGRHVDSHDSLLSKGDVRISVDSISMLETNDTEYHLTPVGWVAVSLGAVAISYVLLMLIGIFVVGPMAD